MSKLKNIIIEEYTKIKEQQKNAIVNGNIVSYDEDDDLNKLKSDPDVKKIKKIDGTIVKEMANTASVTYSLKPNYKKHLAEYNERIKKDSVKIIVNKLVELLEANPSQTVLELFNQIKTIYSDKPEVLAKVKNHQNIKYYLWGGVISNKFNKMYTHVIDPVTGAPYTKGNLNAISWTPFSRTKDAKALSDYEQSLQLKQDNPEEFAARAEKRKQTANPITDAVIEYKNLRAQYFKYNKSSKLSDPNTINSLSNVTKKMGDILNIDVACALLYQWEKGYITLPIDKVLKEFAVNNDLAIMDNRALSLTSKYKNHIKELVKHKKVAEL